jgi:hypothetical protein
VQAREGEGPVRLVRVVGVLVSALLIERITYTERDEPIKYVKSLYRGDRYQFSAMLFKKKGRRGAIRERKGLPRTSGGVAGATPPDAPTR